MEAADKELEDRIREVGNRLSSPPMASGDELLRLLDQTEGLLSKVEQSPSVSMSNALRPAMKELVTKEFLRHSDRDVKVAVAACLSEITRITAPEAPYDDEVMKEVFQRIVEAFENLDDVSSRSSVKRFTMLETVARVRSCVVMLDLECDDLILQMFRYFLKTIRPNHAANVFSSMETIMSLVVEESEDISQDLISCLVESVKINDGISPDAQRLGESVIKNCAEKLKPYLKEFSDSICQYSQVVTSICQGTAAVVQNQNHVSEKKMVEDSKLSERAISDEFPQGSTKTEQEVRYTDEHTEAAEKLSKETANNGTSCNGNGEPDVKESSAEEKSEVSCPSDQPKLSSETVKNSDRVDLNSELVHDKSEKPNDGMVYSDEMKDVDVDSLDAHLEKVETSDKDERNSSEAGTGVSNVPSPVHVEDLATPSGSKEVANSTMPKNKILPSKDSDFKNETDGFSDSERPLKDTCENSQLVDTDQTPENAKVKTQRKKHRKGSLGVRRGLATPSGRKVPTDAGGVKCENLLLKDSDCKKETDSFGDSERPLEDTGEKSHPVDIDQTQENDKIKFPREKNKRGSSAVLRDVATPSGRKGSKEARVVKCESLPSKDSDPEKETNIVNDSEGRPLKDVGEKSQPVDIDQTTRNAEMKSRKMKNKRGSSAVPRDLETSYGRNGPKDAKGVKCESFPSNNADSEKETDSSNDSERRPLKDTGKKSKPVATDQTTDNDEVKSQRRKNKRGSSAVGRELATLSGRKDSSDASGVKPEKLPSNDSDSEETDSFDDSKGLPVKDSGKESQSVDTDETPDKAKIKFQRQRNKRGSSASNVSQGESSQKQQKLNAKHKNKLNPKQGPTKEMVSSRKPVNKSQVEDNLEESLNTLPWRKRARSSTDEVAEAPTRSKIDGSIVGSTIKVWWPDDKQYYEGVVDSYEPSTKKHRILYTDGDVEVLFLKKERWEFVNIVHDSDTAEDSVSQDRSLDEPRGKRMKKSASSGPKVANTDASHKSFGIGSSSSIKRKGSRPKASSSKIDELQDDDDQKTANKTNGKAAITSGHGRVKSGTKPNKKQNTGNSLPDDSRSSKRSHNEENKTPSKKSDSVSTVNKGRKDNARNEKFDETPKTDTKSRRTITPKSGREANGTSTKGKSAVQKPDSSARALSEKGKVSEKHASSVRKRKRK